jgi:hypothetical protein
MSILDTILIEKYKKMIDLDNLLYTNNSILYKNPLNINNNLFVSNTSNIQNVSITSNLLVNNITNNINSITINSKLNVLDNTLFNNNLTNNNLYTNSNLNINNNILTSNISVLNNNTTILSSLLISNSTILNQGLKTNNFIPINGMININSSNINIGNVGVDISNINFNGTISSIITNELNVVDKLISLNADITNLYAIDIGNNGGLEILGTTSTGYIRTSNDSKYYELKYPNNNSLYKIPILDSNNNLYITGATLLYQNNTLKSSLNVNNNLLTNNLSINSSLNILNNTIINNNLTVNNNLYISQTTILNNNVSIYSNFNLNNNLYTSNLSILSSLYISNNSRLNNVSLLSSLYVSNNNIITQNTTVLNSLNVSNISIFNNVSLNSSLNISNNTILVNNTTILSSLYVSSKSKFINNSNILGDLNVLNNSIINGRLTLGSTLNITSTIIINLPEYKDNITAANAGIPLWGFYRTGGIVKIRLDITPPVITILGDNPYLVLLNSSYIDPGATALDNLDGIVSVSSSGSVNTTLEGTYYIIYTSSDSYSNTSTAIRTISVQNIQYYYYTINRSRLYYDGTNGSNFSYYNIFGLNSWTVEAWVYPTTYSNSFTRELLPVMVIGDEHLVFYIKPETQKAMFNVSYGSVITSSNTSIPLNTWTHIAWQRSNSNTFAIYINGIKDLEITLNGGLVTYLNTTPSTPTKHITIGLHAIDHSVWYNYIGRIYQCRISNTALYSSTFIPSTRLSVLSSTLFLLGHTYNDRVRNITGSTSGTISSTKIYFGYDLTASGTWIGSIQKTGYFTSMTQNSNWTIEWYMYGTSWNSGAMIQLGENPDYGQGGLLITQSGNTLQLARWNNNANNMGGATLPTNTWVHCVITWYNGKMYSIINGVWSPGIASYQNLDPSVWNSIYIGYTPWTSGSGEGNYNFSQIKISNVGVYTNPGTSFTPSLSLEPSRPFSNNILFYFGDNTIDEINPSLVVNTSGTPNLILR